MPSQLVKPSTGKITGKSRITRNLQSYVIVLLLAAAAVNFLVGEFAVGGAALAIANATIWLWIYRNLVRLGRSARENYRRLEYLSAVNTAQIIAEINQRSEMDTTLNVAEHKRITDKFTQKSIGVVEREIEQLNLALAAEMRLIREESLMAAEARLAIREQMAELTKAVSNART